MEKNTITPLDKEVAFGVRDMVTRMNRRLRREISNKEQLSVTELNVIQLVFMNERLFPSELCSQLNLSSQHVSQVLNALTDLGYISREASLTDKRKTYAVITSKGSRCLKESREEREEWLAKGIAEQFSSEEKAIIQEAIALLAQLPEI